MFFRFLKAFARKSKFVISVFAQKSKFIANEYRTCLLSYHLLPI